MENKAEQIFGAALSDGPVKDSDLCNDMQTSVFGLPSSPIEAAPCVPTTRPMSALASWVMQQFRDNARHRKATGVDARLEYAAQAQRCKYNERQRMALMRAGVDEKVFSPITATKIRAAKAMLCDIFQSAGEWPFTLAPTPDPEVPKMIVQQAMSDAKGEIDMLFSQLQSSGIREIPPQAEQMLSGLVRNFMSSRYDSIKNKNDLYARIRAKRMERKIQDIMAEGGWVEAFNEYVNYICVYGTGLIAMTPRAWPMHSCHEQKDKNGNYTGFRKYTTEYKVIPRYEAINPVDCYPAPNAIDVDDGPLCIRVRFTPAELRQYVDRSAHRNDKDGVGDGWSWKTVQALLSIHPNGGISLNEEPQSSVIRDAESKEVSVNESMDCTMEGVRCFASVRGSHLIGIGVTANGDGAKIEEADFYSVEVIVIGGYVVFCRIIDDRIGRPVSKGVFYEFPGSWWGESIAEKCALVQNVMNNCIVALLTNMSVASGPMYWINDVSRLIDKSPDALKFQPHKVLAFSQSIMGQNSGAPFGVVQIPSNASELMAVWDKMRIQSDDDSGIPAYTYGQSSGQGALRTASGLAIFTEAASRGMKMVVGTTDRLVTRDMVKKTASWVLIYDRDLEIKGDCEVFPAGVMGKILKAQQDQQRLQLLQMVVNNQTLTQIIGPKGIMALFRPSVQDVNINPDDVMPSEERLREMEVIQSIAQIFQATQQANAQEDAAAGGQNEGGQTHQQPQQQQSGEVGGGSPRPGSVAERRSVA